MPREEGKELTENLRHLSAIHREQFNKRRKYEWRAFTTVLSFYVLVVAAYYSGNFSLPSRWYVTLALWTVSLGLATATCLYLRSMHEANSINKKFAEAAENAIIDQSGLQSLRLERDKLGSSGMVNKGLNWSLRWQMIFILCFAVITGLLLTMRTTKLSSRETAMAGSNTSIQQALDKAEVHDAVNALVTPDVISLLALHALFYAFLIFALVKNKSWQRPGNITRGEKSWSKFYLTHALLLLLLFQVISTTAPPDNRNWFPLLSIIDFLGVSYLALLNGWFRNWLIGLFNRLEKKPE